jgi:hypothetical protein
MFNTFNTSNGYNHNSGGEVWEVSDATKKKMRENHYDNSGENNPFFGKHHTEESNKKNSIANCGENNYAYGKYRSEETLKKMSIAKSGENHPLWSKHRSEETRKLISKNHADVSGENHPQVRAVILISPEGKKYDLPCYGPFCKEHNLNRAHICGVLQGKSKHHKGWTGKYHKNKKINSIEENNKCQNM